MAWTPQPLVVVLWAIAALLVLLALVAWSRRSRTRGARSSPSVLQVFDLAGFTTIVRFFDDVDAAVASFA